ncbi:MAG: dihydrolipoamide acetyltransferase family protein [Bacteroidota bacterium]|nr:dihydrolipoamide acetyltransferase family protein [Bacteroidota bacterium]MDE2956151.1 dihydrolipoamide acetyltransferase family protein [Bacteroidota bacterium]
MAIAVEMPKMTDTMQEGVLVAWLVEEGSTIAAGDVIAQVETDKATMDVEAYDDGVLLQRVAEEGDALPIGSLIAILGKAGEDASAVLSEYQGVSRPDKAPTEDPAEPAVAPKEGIASPMAAAESGRIKVSPLARKMAADHGLSLTHLAGSGPEGRIIKRDIASALASRDEPEQVPGVREYTSIRITQMRKAIARRLAESKFTSPHFYLTADVSMERCVEARRAINKWQEDRGEKGISYNDFVTKACAVSLAQHPAVNSSYHAEDGEIRQYSYVDIGIAVALEEGLVTPVVRDAHSRSLLEIAAETRALAARARNRQLQPEEMAGSTFTTSNLGMFGIESFTAIINPPNAAILAIGAIRDVPVVEDGRIEAGKRMHLTLSCDHRAVDGATGARFLAAVQAYLEEPLTLLL